MNSSIPRWYLISKAEAMEQPFSLAPIYLIIIKMWCYYLWMRCSTTFNSLLFLRPCIFCPTLSFPGEIWGGRGSSGAFLASLVCLSLSLSLPPSFILLLSLSLTQCYLYFLHESASLSLQERWSKVWLFLMQWYFQRSRFILFHSQSFFPFHRVCTNSMIFFYFQSFMTTIIIELWRVFCYFYITYSYVNK